MEEINKFKMMEEKRGWKLLLRNNILSLVFVVSLLVLGIVFATGIIVKEGKVEVEDLNATGTSYFGDIFSTGNVGIGTTSPDEKLDVAGDIALTGSTRRTIEFGAAGGAAPTTQGTESAGEKLVLWNASNYKATIGIKTGGELFFQSTDYNNSHISFYTGGVDVAGTERLRIGADGKVGIGTTSPNEKLDVVGNVTVGGELEVTGVSSETGKVVCIKADGNLGTCTNQPDVSGGCSCS